MIEQAPPSFSQQAIGVARWGRRSMSRRTIVEQGAVDTRSSPGHSFSVIGFLRLPTRLDHPVGLEPAVQRRRSDPELPS